MIDFDDIEETADERAAAGDLDEAARAALSCPESTKRSGEDLSLDELLGRSAQVSAATGATFEEAPTAKSTGADSAKATRRGLCELDTGPSHGEALGAEEGLDAAGDEPDVAAFYQSWGSKPGAAGKSGKVDSKSKRRSLCELSPAWSPQVPPSGDEQHFVESRTFDEPQVSPGLPTETTAAEAPSTREDSSSESEVVDVGAAAAEPEKTEPEPAKPSGAAASDACEWPARPDEAHFRIFDAVLPMQLPREGMTPQDVAKVWEEEWGVAYARTLRFQSPDSSSKRWLNPREDPLPCSPTVVRLDGKAGVLNALALSLRQHDERLKSRSGADAARRRLAQASTGGASFGPRIRPAATANRRGAPAAGRGTPFQRRAIPLLGEDL